MILEKPMTKSLSYGTLLAVLGVFLPSVASTPAPASSPALVTSTEVGKATVLARMMDAIRSAKCLRVEATAVHAGRPHRIVAWMGVGRYREEVYRTGGPEPADATERLVYARSARPGRVQEFASSYMFAGDRPATNVLVEYDVAADEGTGPWSRLMSKDFSCDVGGAVGGSWLDAGEDTVPHLMRSQAMDSVMSVEPLGDAKCRVFRLNRIVGEDRLGYELWLDATTNLPVKEIVTVVKDAGKSTKSVTYRVEVLPSDDGIEWVLDAKTLVR